LTQRIWWLGLLLRRCCVGVADAVITRELLCFCLLRRAASVGLTQFSRYIAWLSASGGLTQFIGPCLSPLCECPPFGNGDSQCTERGL
jgi:hypothetical protein